MQLPDYDHVEQHNYYLHNKIYSSVTCNRAQYKLIIKAAMHTETDRHTHTTHDDPQ